MPQGGFSKKQTLKVWCVGCLLESILRFKICRKEGNEAGLGKTEAELKSGLVTTLVIPTEALELRWLVSDAPS